MRLSREKKKNKPGGLATGEGVNAGPPAGGAP